jgi:mycofactocin precursor
VALGAISVARTTPAVEEAAQMIENPEQENTEPQGELVAEDLIEEVSIDGMCGVY